MKRLSLFLFLLLLWGSWLMPASPAQAACVVQGATTYPTGTYLPTDICDTNGARTVTTSGASAPVASLQTAAVATGNGTALTVSDKGTVGIAVTGTFVGTITFEGSTDGTTWTSTYCAAIDTLVSNTTTSSTGQYVCSVTGFTGFRARISSYTSGSITVTGFPTAAGGGGGAGGGGSLSATATAAAPSYVEGYTQAALSVDTSGSLRTNLTTLLSCEDQPNSLCRVGPGVPLISTVMTGVTTNTTSAAIVIFSGGKTPIAQVVGTGAVTATIDLYGDNDSDAANGLGLCTITLSGTTKAVGGCDGAKQITRDFAFYYASTTNVTGTGATVKLEVASGMAGYTGNISQINGATPLMGAGNTGTGSQRVTEATDSQLSAGVGATGDAAATVGSTGSLTAKQRLMTSQLDAIQTSVGLIDDDQTGSSTCYFTSAATNNAQFCKAAAGRIMYVRVINTTSTIYYLRLYNLTAAPTCSSATGFVETIPAGHSSGNGGGTVFANGPSGAAYGTGIAFCLTGGGSSTDNTNAATGVYITVGYK